MFKKGDKVKCVDASNLTAAWPDLKKGEIYIVADFQSGTTDLVLLEGKKNSNWHVFGLRANRFVLADAVKEANVCTCTIQTLMSVGCQCGVFTKEQNHATSI